MIGNSLGLRGSIASFTTACVSNCSGQNTASGLAAARQHRRRRLHRLAQPAQQHPVARAAPRDVQRVAALRDRHARHRRVDDILRVFSGESTSQSLSVATPRHTRPPPLPHARCQSARDPAPKVPSRPVCAHLHHVDHQRTGGVAATHRLRRLRSAFAAPEATDLSRERRKSGRETAAARRRVRRVPRRTAA